MTDSVPHGDPERTSARVAELEAEVEALREQLHAAWGQIQGMRASASWRITYPLRTLRRMRRR